MRTPAACRGQLRFRLLLLPLLVLAAAATSEDWVELPSSGDGESRTEAMYPRMWRIVKSRMWDPRLEYVDYVLLSKIG